MTQEAGFYITPMKSLFLYLKIKNFEYLLNRTWDHNLILLYNFFYYHGRKLLIFFQSHKMGKWFNTWCQAKLFPKWPILTKLSPVLHPPALAPIPLDILERLRALLSPPLASDFSFCFPCSISGPFASLPQNKSSSPPGARPPTRPLVLWWPVKASPGNHLASTQRDQISPSPLQSHPHFSWVGLSMSS